MIEFLETRLKVMCTLRNYGHILYTLGMLSAERDLTHDEIELLKFVNYLRNKKT